MAELPRMYPVWVEAENTRVYGIDADPDGDLWFTGSLPQLHRYDPVSGAIDTIAIPESHGGSQCIWCGDKIYILPQSNQSIAIYHITEERLEQVDKPFPEANLWYGEADRERNLLYLPERSRPCLVVWDVSEEAGQVLPFPEAGVLPALREVEWAEGLHAQDVPDAVGTRRVYFDPGTGEFVAEDSDPIPPLGPGSGGEHFEVSYRTTNEDGSFLADGRVIRHDRQTGECHERPIPGYGEEFTFIGGGVFFRGWQMNCLSTYRQTYSYDPVADGFTPRPWPITRLQTRSTC